MHAAVEDHKVIVNLLIEAGADLDLRDNEGEAALMHAARNGHKETVDVLIKAGADVNPGDHNGTTALMHAVKKGHKEIVELLMSAGADANQKSLFFGNIALWTAAEEGHKEIIELLVRFGAEASSYDRISKLTVEQQKGYYLRKWYLFAYIPRHRCPIGVLLHHLDDEAKQAFLVALSANQDTISERIIEDIIWCAFGIPNELYRTTIKSAFNQFNKAHPDNILSQHFKASRYTDSLSLLTGTSEKGVINNIQAYIGYDPVAIGLFASLGVETGIMLSKVQSQSL